MENHKISRVLTQTTKTERYDESFEWTLDLDHLSKSLSSTFQSVEFGPLKGCDEIIKFEAFIKNQDLRRVFISIKVPKLAIFGSPGSEVSTEVVGARNTIVKLLKGEKSIVIKEIKYHSTAFSREDFGLQFHKWIDFGNIKIDRMDTLSISFILEIETVSNPKVLKPNAELNFLQPFSDFRNSLWDVKIICGGQEFKAHKLLLSVASPVFKKMFESGLKEAAEGQILIQELEPKMLKLLLDGIYSGSFKAGDFPELRDLIDLYKAAHRYCMDSLKEWVEGQIESKISVRTVLEVFAWSGLYGNNKLREKALEFIKREKKEIFKDPSVLLDFMNDNREHVKLIHELLII